MNLSGKWVYSATLDKTLLGFISCIIKEAESTYVIPKNDPKLKKLLKRSTAPIGGEQLIKTYLEQFLILLIRNILKKKEPSLFPSKESMDNHLVSAARRLLEEKAEDPFRVNDLCVTLGFSKSYLSKLFHEQTGYPCRLCNSSKNKTRQAIDTRRKLELCANIRQAFL